MRIIPVLLTALVLSACTSAGTSDTSTTLAPVAAPTTAAGVEGGSSTPDAVKLPPQIDSYRVKQVQVGDQELTLAIADNPSLRSQGLQRVTDLEDLDGMLFFWRHDGDAFWMKNTVIPLDIVWFNPDGTYKGRASMEPCTTDPCPKYQPDDFEFRYAIEAPTGTLDWVTEDTVIVYVDD